MVRPLDQVGPQITELFHEASAQHQFSVLSAGADKHGSVVWEAAASINGLNRYVMFSITMLADGIEERLATTYTSGADNDRCFVVQAVETDDSSVQAIQNNLKTGMVRQRLNDSFERSAQFSEADLDQEYVVPRSPARA